VTILLDTRNPSRHRKSDMTKKIKGHGDLMDASYLSKCDRMADDFIDGSVESDVLESGLYEVDDSTLLFVSAKIR
jgi:hypothetical protein